MINKIIELRDKIIYIQPEEIGMIQGIHWFGNEPGVNLIVTSDGDLEWLPMQEYLENFSPVKVGDTVTSGDKEQVIESLNFLVHHSHPDGTYDWYIEANIK